VLRYFPYFTFFRTVYNVTVPRSVPSPTASKKWAVSLGYHLVHRLRRAFASFRSAATISGEVIMTNLAAGELCAERRVASRP